MCEDSRSNNNLSMYICKKGIMWLWLRVDIYLYTASGILYSNPTRNTLLLKIPSESLSTIVLNSRDR